MNTDRPTGMRTRLASVVVALALVAAAACGGGEDRPDLPISLSSGGNRGEAATAAAEDSAGGGAAADMRMAMVDYKLDADTSDLPDEGPAYEVKSSASESEVRELAEGLGLDGDAKRGERKEWYVSGDGGALLTVEPMAGSPWYFQSEGACAPDTAVSSDGDMACGRVAASSGSSGSSASSGSATDVDPAEREKMAEEGDGGATVTEPAAAPAPVCKPQPDGSEICEGPTPPEYVEPERPANLPTKGEAEETARALLTKLGVDLEDAAVRTEDGFSAWFVSVEPTIDGLPVYGFGWSVTVGPEKKVQSASGHLGDATKVADYPLIDVEDAIKALTEQYAVADIAVDCSDTPSGEGAGTEALCAEAPPVEPQVQRITAVELGLVWSPSYTESGPSYLTPAWVLTIDGGGEMPVNALPEEFVQKPPVDEPVPADGGGTDGGRSEPGSPGVETEPQPDSPPPAPAEG